MIQLTEKAIHRVREVVESEKKAGLRLGVRGGGCSGLSYVTRYESGPGAQDRVFEFDGVKVFVDPKSFMFLDGITLDWKDTLIEKSFVFINPKATKSCGCGTSFS